MAVSIKVQVMHKLAEVLEGIPGIGSVNRWEGKPIDLDTLKMPALFLYEESEHRDKRNRLAVGVIKLAVMVFIPLTPAGAVSFNDAADTLQGQIHNALIGSTALKGLVENIVEGEVRKEMANDLYGALYQTFDITYMHTWGDAFSVAY